MKNLLKAIILVIVIGILGFITSWKVWGQDNKITDTVKIDTVKVKPQDTIVDVKGKYVLFIGDSHTSNHGGWQTILSNQTKMRMNNISVGGKTTGWMLERAKESIHEGLDYCFIYGGANDMYNSKITIESAVRNIQKIVNICNSKGVKPVVITGFDPLICINTPENPNYRVKYSNFQYRLLNTIKGATVIMTHVVDRKDCWDGLCHMSPSGHKKIANHIIDRMNFKTY
jgi:lysophospholipase L1-like esterase